MLRALAEVMFPATCPGCGGRGEPLCDACARGLRHVPPPSIVGLDAVHVPFAYSGVVRELVARAKYRHRHAALGWLADAMVAELAAAPVAVDVVTWAPTTAARRRARGFDQAELLAVAVAAGTGVPCRAALRRVGTGQQTGRTRAERVVGPEFTVRASRVVTGRRVLLVDDVVTTGATLRAAADALRAAGVTSVIGLAAARRP